MDQNVMLIAGAAIQWVRALPWTGKWKAIQPAVCAVLIAAIGAGCFWLSTPDAASHGARFFILGAWEWIKEAGIGTLLTSMGASTVVACGASPEHAAIPVTNK